MAAEVHRNESARSCFPLRAQSASVYFGSTRKHFPCQSLMRDFVDFMNRLWKFAGGRRVFGNVSRSRALADQPPLED
jgi:hypothetical protein